MNFEKKNINDNDNIIKNSQTNEFIKRENKRQSTTQQNYH